MFRAKHLTFHAVLHTVADKSKVIKKRRNKGNAHHRDNRKNKRLIMDACNIAEKLGCKIVDSEFSPEITGNYQIGDAELIGRILNTFKKSTLG